MTTTATRTFPDLASTPDEMAASMTEHYGIRVSYIGEDGDMIALGHHAPEQVLEAFDRLACSEGLALTDANEDRRHATPSLERRMARLVTACESPDHDQDTADGGCGQCAMLADGAWYLEWGDPNSPSTFPITMWVA